MINVFKIVIQSGNIVSGAVCYFADSNIVLTFFFNQFFSGLNKI